MNEPVIVEPPPSKFFGTASVSFHHITYSNIIRQLVVLQQINR